MFKRIKQPIIFKVKNEFIKRFNYIFDNKEFIIGPSLPFVSQMELDILKALEDTLLGPVELINIRGYKYLEELKKDKEYCLKIKNGVQEYMEKSKNMPMLEEKMDINTIFYKVYEYIYNQKSDKINRDKKLKVIDEYIRMGRYQNDGKVWNSGYNFTVHDTQNCNNFIGILKKMPKRSRELNDIGIPANLFISYMAGINFSEEEKQVVYLSHHEEIPWNLMINCERSSTFDLYFSNQNNTNNTLKRPPHSKPCGKDFNIKEENIFISPYYDDYKLHYLCPYCGYITDIPDNTVSKVIRTRIIDRCKDNENLYHENYLKSEEMTFQSINKKPKQLFL